MCSRRVCGLWAVGREEGERVQQETLRPQQPGYVYESVVLRDSFRPEDLGRQVGPLQGGLHLGLAPFPPDPALPP